MNSTPDTPHDCDRCGQPHAGLFRTCDACLAPAVAEANAAAAAVEQHTAAEVARSRAAAWNEICPPAYQSTDWQRSHLSPVCRDLARRWAPDWGTERCGLGIYGSTGLGKTRAMFWILRRLHFAGVSVMALDAVRFARSVGDWNASDSTDRREARRLIGRAQNVRVLLLDDLAKERSTPAVASALHDLLEIRTRHFRPILFTTERTGDELAGLLGGQSAAGNFADGIIRRLRGACSIHAASAAE